MYGKFKKDQFSDLQESYILPPSALILTLIPFYGMPRKPPMNLRLMSQKLTALKTHWVYESNYQGPLLSTLYILERVSIKICIDFSQFSETNALLTT